MALPIPDVDGLLSAALLSVTLPSRPTVRLRNFLDAPGANIYTYVAMIEIIVISARLDGRPLHREVGICSVRVLI